MSLNVEKAVQLNRDQMNRLRGRLFGFFDALGLPADQNKAVKKIVRDLTYDAQVDIESTLRGDA
jgi:hypothetical protein